MIGDLRDGFHDRTPAVPDNWRYDAHYDSLGKGCGEVMLELRNVLKRLEPGALLLVTAEDAGASCELSTWCRTTGHSLRASAHPHYLIQRKLRGGR